MRGAHHGGLVADLSRLVGEPNRLPNAFHAGAGEQEFLGRRELGDPLPKLNLLLDREHDALAGGAADHVARERREIPLLDVMFELGSEQIAVAIERRGDGREDAWSFMCQRGPEMPGPLPTIMQP